MSDIKVLTVTIPPAIGKPEMQQGIKSEASARTWAQKRGYTTVYWYKSRERVYADKAEKRAAQLTLG